MIYKDIGIVIKQREFSDYDRILTIITRRHGKISALAKGVRRLTSKKAASTDLFVRSKYSFAEGKNLDILTEAISEDNYEKSKSNYEKISTLFYLSQVIDKLVVEGDTLQSITIFDLFDKTVNLLGKNLDSNHFNELIVSAFELHLLKLLGLLPDFYNCIDCGKSLKNSKTFQFKSSHGGIICSDCSNNFDYGNVSKDALKTLRYLSENPIDVCLNFNCDKSVLSSVNLVNKGMLTYFAELHIDQ